MSPLNKGGPLLGTGMPPMPLTGMRPPSARFGRRLLTPGIPPMRMPPRPLPMRGMFLSMRQRIPPPRPGIIMRPGGPPPMFGPRIGFGQPMGPPMMGPRYPRGPPLRPGPRGIPPPHMLMRPNFPQGNNVIRSKGINAKKANKLEENELKKPWMTDAIRSEIQRKNKLYAKAKKSKNGKEWEEFKDLRNKVTRMIRDAKSDNEKKSENKATIPVQQTTSNQETPEIEKVQESDVEKIQDSELEKVQESDVEKIQDSELEKVQESDLGKIQDSELEKDQESANSQVQDQEKIQISGAEES